MAFGGPGQRGPMSPKASFTNAGMNNQIHQEIQDLASAFKDEQDKNRKQNEMLMEQNKELMEMLRSNNKQVLEMKKELNYMKNIVNKKWGTLKPS